MHKIIKKVLIISVISFFCLNNHAYATNISDLEDEREEQEQKKEEAQAVVDQLQNQKDNIMAAIEELDEKVNHYNSQIVDIKNQKAELEKQISQLEEELVVAKAEEDRQYEAMKRRIQYAYENNEIEYIDTLFSTSDISDIVNQQEYFDQIYNYDSTMLNELIEVRKTIANKEALIQTNLAALLDLETQVTENQQAVEILMNGKKDQVGSYIDSIEDYEEQVAQYQAGIEEMDNQIAAAEAAAEEARKEAIRKKKEEWLKQQQEKGEEVSSDTDAPDFEDMFYEETPTSLQWPVSTGGVITSEFGPRWGSMHNGLDIGCDMYTPIVAAEDGTVILSEYDSSAGNYVIIDHGGGMTTVYMHNSELVASVGDTVVRGQVIAYSGSTGWSTGPHCHIGVRIDGVYVDPLPYLTN